MTRRPRFQRSNDAPPTQLTERDIAIIRHVYAHRFLRSTHIRKLVGGSSAAVLRRLQRLFHHGYLDRPRAQIEYYRRGSQPMVYGIGNRGATELKHRLGIESGTAVWTQKNHAATRLYVEHTLAVADVMVAFELACRHRNDVKLIPLEQTVTKPTKQPVQWNVTVRHGGASENLCVIPDRVFALCFANQPHRSAIVFLEADRGTMPVVRRSLRQSSVFRKLLAYHASWQQKLHTSLFGYKRCVVLTVTTSNERIATLIKANSELNSGGGSALFVFAENESLMRCDDVLSAPIRNGRDQLLCLGE